MHAIVQVLRPCVHRKHDFAEGSRLTHIPINRMLATVTILALSLALASSSTPDGVFLVSDWNYDLHAFNATANDGNPLMSMSARFSPGWP